MFRIILIFFWTISAQIFAQVSKPVNLNTVPEGALVTSISGKEVFLGKTPLNHTFEFHSEISVLKIRLSACGFNDSILKINPNSGNLTIRLEKKKLSIIQETDKDVINENERKLVSSLVVDFLDEFSLKNLGSPINYTDFVFMKQSPEGITLNIVFELDHNAFPVIKGIKADSVLNSKWEEWFGVPVKKLKSEKLNGIRIYFSVISGKNNFSIHYNPGVDVNDELRQQVTVYNDYYLHQRVTVTTNYYVTVVTPTFNTSNEMTRKYYELLYEVGKDSAGKDYALKQKAFLSFTNGKLNTVFTTSPDIDKNSMLIRFLENK